METIIPFRPNARTLRPRGLAPGQPFGEIVIFPGVRMERHATEVATLEAPTGESADGNGRPRKTS